MRHALSAVVACWLLVIVLPTTLLASVDLGTEAYERGDYREAFKLWRPLADQGDPAAQYNLAILYEYGLGTFRDVDRAVNLYVKAAEQGFPEAQVAVGDYYLEGYWGEPDFEEAAAWYGFAADQGHGQAVVKLTELGAIQAAALPQLDSAVVPKSDPYFDSKTCPPIDGRDFTVKVTTKFPEPPINHSLSISQLSQKSFHGKNSRVLGLMQPDLDIETSHRYGTQSWPNKTCFWIESINVEMTYRSIEVFIAREYRRGSCAYRAILEHEREHVEIARHNLNRYKPEVRRALTSLLIPTPDRAVEVDSAEAANEALQRLYKKILDPVYQRMLSDLHAK